jgi:hypothetical protein
MPTSRFLLILSGLGLLAVMIFCGVRYKSKTLSLPVSIQGVEVTTNKVRFHYLLPRAYGFSGFTGFVVEETNKSTVNASVVMQGQIKSEVTNSWTIEFAPSVKPDMAYRVAAYYLSRNPAEEKLCSWGQHIPFLNNILPEPRQGVATSEWFVVKSDQLPNENNTMHPQDKP